MSGDHRSSSPFAASGVFCIVCGRFDGELVPRKSGLKCRDCVGKHHKKDYRQLQKHQAAHVLAQTLRESVPQQGQQQQRPTRSPRSPSAGDTIRATASPTFLSQLRLSLDHGSNSSNTSTSGAPSTSVVVLYDGNAPFAIDELAVAVEQPVTQDLTHQVSVFSTLRLNVAETATTYKLTTSWHMQAGPSSLSASSGSVMPKQSSGLSKSFQSPQGGQQTLRVIPIVEVRRRFRDIFRVFEALKLLESASGGFLPDLPEKRIINRFAPDFIEARRSSVEGFVNCALRSPFLCRHPQLQELLGLESAIEKIIAVTAETEHDQEGDAGGIRPKGAATVEIPELGSSMSSACFDSDELSEEILRGCKIGSLLGKGTFGYVHLGLLAQTSQLVAVKTVAVASTCSDHPQQLANMLQELEVMRSLRHPNVVRFLGSVWDAEKRVLSMFAEFVECGSVASVVRKFGRLPITVIQKYMKQILTGLAYLHSLRVVHRDIKGDNILVTKRGQVKLADFGCSMVMAVARTEEDEKGGGSAAQTRGERHDRSLHGTPLFLAPELLIGEEDDDDDDEVAGRRDHGKQGRWDRHSFSAMAAADIWSVGCVGIEMLQRDIWNVDRSANVFAVMFKIARAHSYPHGMPEAGTVPHEFADFLQQCLQWDPWCRPTAQDLLQHPFFSMDAIAASSAFAGISGLIDDVASPPSSPRHQPQQPVLDDLLGNDAEGGLPMGRISPFAPQGDVSSERLL